MAALGKRQLHEQNQYALLLFAGVTVGEVL